jgi:UDP-glucose 4-epimerase
MAVCLVTGGAGFIGSHLVDALLAAGHAVRVLDNFSTGRLSNLTHVRERIELIAGDLTDLGVVREAVQGIDWVFHLAAGSAVKGSVADPLTAHHACATGTMHVLMAAREARVRRVIYASSSVVYGNSGEILKREKGQLLPLTPYAAAKLAGEQYCAAFTQCYGLETVRLRYFNVFGPRQLPNHPDAGVVPLFFDAMLAGQSPVLYGSGHQSRDFTYVDNVVQANLLAAEAPRVVGKVYNIAFGRSTTLLDLMDMLNDILGTEVQPIHEKARPGDIRHSQADISRAQVDLGYCPMIDLKEGLRRCFTFYEAHKEHRPVLS